MPYLAVDQLQPGMTLESDVTDASGRLLLSKGSAVEFKHLNIFKMWGVHEVCVYHAGEGQGDSGPSSDPDILRHVAETLKPAFGDNDLTHPAVAEIFRQAVMHRSRQPARAQQRRPVMSDSRTPASTLSGAEMRNKLKNRDIELPEIPVLIYKLNDTIADPFSSAEDIARVISHSPGLSALLLRIVNSAFYGFPSRIDSITRAVAIIGSKEVSALAVGITTMEIFKDIPKTVFDVRAFTHHCLACGVLARILAASGNIRNTEQLFVSGLLHDIGRMLIFQHFPRMAALMLSASADDRTCLYDLEKSVLGFRHTDVAADLFEKWKFPVALSQNVICHHRPLGAQDPVKAAIIHLSDMIAHALGEGRSGERRVPRLDAGAWNQLRFSPQLLATVIPQAVHHLGFLTTVFLDGD